MSDQWHVIKRAEATNLVINPSYEVNVTDGWTSTDSGVGAIFGRDTSFTYYGIACAYITAGNALAYYNQATFSVADGETVYILVMTASNVAEKNLVLLFDTTNAATRIGLAGTLVNTWEKLTGSWTNSTGLAATCRILLQNSAADDANNTRFDGVAAFIGVDSTYVDGDQPGCEWNGQAHNSTSTRSALSFDGGIEYDFGSDLAFWVDTEAGLSAPPVSNTFQNYAMTKGAFYNGSNVLGRPFTLPGLVVGTSKTTLHDKMHDLIDIFDVRGKDLVRLQYDGGTTPKWFKARYEAGLEGNYVANRAVTQRVALRMFAPDPDMYQVNDTNVVLDVNDTATLRYIARRNRTTGQWDDMGLTANPAGGGTILAILKASDGLVYIGGDFTGWDGNADRDYGVIYNPQTDAFSTWGAANDITERIRDIKEGPDGTIYVGGEFVNVGDANGDCIVSWTTAGAWVSLGAPAIGGGEEVKSIDFDSSGNMYVGGLFEDLAGVPAADGFAKWDGTNWTAVGVTAVTGVEFIAEIAIDIDDNIYVVGDCDNIGGVTYDNIAMWNGAAWVDVGVGLNDYALAARILNDGKTLVVGGNFTTAGGTTNANYVTLWNGQQYQALGTPPDDVVNTIEVAPNDDIYVGGAFTAIGDFATASSISAARWNGATWTLNDLGTWGIVFAIAFANVSPVTNENFDVYLGTSQSASVEIAGSATVNNPGNADAYPTFIIKRTGGTSAYLYSIRNETTGKTIHMQPLITDGDTITIELSSEGSKVTSAWPGKDRYKYAILANSDDGTFVLIPGDNNITVFCDLAGAPTMTANCVFKAVFTGYDD